MNRKKTISIILKHLLRAFIALAISSALIFIISRQISKIGNSLMENKKLSFIFEKRNETIKKLRQDFEMIGGNAQKMQNALPPADNILEFVGALESLSAQNSLAQSLKFDTPVDFSSVQDGNLKISTVDYNINLNGNIFILLNYLRSFEKLPYFTGISFFNLSGSNWENNSSISMKARLYVKTPQE